MIKRYDTNALDYDDSNPKPVATTDVHDVVSLQLTENTGRHMLDSGSHYGRHWEENRDDPPWEQPEWDVQEEWVTHNIYHFMTENFTRNEACFALEASLYAYGIEGGGKDMSWLATMKDWADKALSGMIPFQEQVDSGLTQNIIEMANGMGDIYAGESWTANTYNNHDTHALSQELQMVNIGMPVPRYVLVQVHGGCDIRGGYTSPRVYRVHDIALPMELMFYAPGSNWSDAESVLYDDDSLLYQPEIDEDSLVEHSRRLVSDMYSDKEVEMMADKAVTDANDADDIDGAVFRASHDSVEHVVFS